MKVSDCGSVTDRGAHGWSDRKAPEHSSAFTTFTETSDSLSLLILTLKIIPSKMSILIRGNVDSFKVKASVFWFESLCGVPTHGPCSDISLSLASDGGQWTAQFLCYLTCIWDFLQEQRDCKLKLVFYPREICW